MGGNEAGRGRRTAGLSGQGMSGECVARPQLMTTIGKRALGKVCKAVTYIKFEPPLDPPP